MIPMNFSKINLSKDLPLINIFYLLSILLSWPFLLLLSLLVYDPIYACGINPNSQKTIERNLSSPAHRQQCDEEKELPSQPTYDSLQMSKIHNKDINNRLLNELMRESVLGKRGLCRDNTDEYLDEVIGNIKSSGLHKKEHLFLGRDQNGQLQSLIFFYEDIDFTPALLKKANLAKKVYHLVLVCTRQRGRGWGQQAFQEIANFNRKNFSRSPYVVTLESTVAAYNFWTSKLGFQAVPADHVLMGDRYKPLLQYQEFTGKEN